MFSPDGQNWGFPVYDWDTLGRESYRWWKDRLSQAGKFFHAFRIDHVLGFFRIWRIPQGEVTGLLGRFSPSAGLPRADLQAMGFDDGRLRWLSVPHVSASEIAAALGGDAARVAGAYLRRIGTEDLYNPAPEYDSESALRALDEPAAVKSFLLSLHSNRTLLDDGPSGSIPRGTSKLERAFRASPRGRKESCSTSWAAAGRNPRKAGSAPGASCSPSCRAQLT
jgi:4-alpha-glucanotransferase